MSDDPHNSLQLDLNVLVCAASGSDLTVQGVISCGDHLNSHWPVWSSLQWPQTFFIPTPTLTCSQMNAKGKFVDQKIDM